ncbi:MAG: PLDc_N domain-containing protein [Candidatus Synoicihabitans palmerolidicus]|nr:PLDc_N domain-containing protein [Candidatus Synoicihabitans palmerolidicus]
MLVDCLLNETDPQQTLIWITVIIFVPFVGAPLYFGLRKIRRTPPTKT